MKPLLSALALTTALTIPALALAKPLTLTTALNNYGGDGAYLTLYVTDAAGVYMRPALSRTFRLRRDQPFPR